MKPAIKWILPVMLISCAPATTNPVSESLTPQKMLNAIESEVSRVGNASKISIPNRCKLSEQVAREDAIRKSKSYGSFAYKVVGKDYTLLEEINKSLILVKGIGLNSKWEKSGDGFVRNILKEKEMALGNSYFVELSVYPDAGETSVLCGVLWNF